MLMEMQAMTSSLPQLALILSFTHLCVGQQFSWGASDYYMGWSGGSTWMESREQCKAR